MTGSKEEEVRRRGDQRSFEKMEMADAACYLTAMQSQPSI